MEDFTKWQIIIINWLAAQSENKMSQFPNWKNVMQELNIHEKCDLYLYNDLQKWYAAYRKNNQFPPQPKNLPKEVLVQKPNKSKIKTKTVYDQNKNKIKITLPPNQKSNNLDLERKKQEILNYLKQENINPPITWTKISHKLGYNYDYTLEARKALKKWYTNYRQEILQEWNKQNLFTDNFSNIENQFVRSIEIPIDLGNQNLRNQLILIFNQLKQQVLGFRDPKLIEYYEAFFQQFTPKLLLQNCIINHGSQGLKIINKFHNVFDLNSFKDYLESIPGLYSKLALWTIKNPFPIQGFVIKHHLMPRFLKNNGFSSEQLEKSYNLVYISRAIHYLMHITRLVEYAQFQDSDAVELMLRNQASNKSILWGSNSLQNIAKIMYDSLNSEMLNNYPQFEKEVSQKRRKQIQRLAVSKMNCKTKTILTSTTVWRHTEDKTFEYTNYSQDPDNISLDAFTRSFINVYTNHQKLNNQPLFYSHDTKFTTIREQFSMYFRGKTSFVQKFYIVNPFDFIKPIKQPKK